MPISARIAAWQAWSASPSRHRIWRVMEDAAPSNPRRARMRKGSQSTRSKACGRLPVLTSAWPWQPGECWMMWKGSRVESLLDPALLRPVVWSCWMRTLDTLGVEHGGRGVVNLALHNRCDHVKRLRIAIERIEQLGGPIKPEVNAALITRLVTDLATLQGEHTARAQFGADAYMLSDEVSRVIRSAVSAERDMIEHDLGRAHILGDVKQAGH